MPGKVLLDTNVIIAFFSGEKAVSKRFMESEVFVSSTALGELYYARVNPLTLALTWPGLKNLPPQSKS